MRQSLRYREPCGGAAWRRGREGFTLIELLVVIAVIVVLIGILTPTIRGVLEHARISLCLNDLRQMSTVHRRVASDQIRQGRYVCGTATIDGAAKSWPGPECIWLKNGVNDADFGLYRSQGVLAAKALIDPKVMYCPSWDIESWLPGNRDGGKGGWVPEDIARDTLTAIVSTYYYRDTFGPSSTAWRPAQIGDDPEGEALMADAFTTLKGTTTVYLAQHDPYVGVAYLDTHAELIVPMTNPVPPALPKAIPQYITNWGTLQTQTFYGNIEKAFKDCLSKK